MINSVELIISTPEFQDVVTLKKLPNKYWGVQRYQSGIEPGPENNISLLNITFPESSRALDVFKNHFVRAVRESIPFILKG